jgi:hypothetical protein
MSPTAGPPSTRTTWGSRGQAGRTGMRALDGAAGECAPLLWIRHHRILAAHVSRSWSETAGALHDSSTVMCLPQPASATHACTLTCHAVESCASTENNQPGRGRLQGSDRLRYTLLVCLWVPCRVRPDLRKPLRAQDGCHIRHSADPHAAGWSACAQANNCWQVLIDIVQAGPLCAKRAHSCCLPWPPSAQQAGGRQSKPCWLGRAGLRTAC